MTNREFFNAVIKANINPEVTEMATSLLTKLDEKNAKRKNTETKEQKENKVLMEKILVNLSAGIPTSASVLGGVLGVSTQKASALCVLLEKEGKVVVTEIKVKGKGKVKGYLLPSPITEEVAD